MVKSCSQKKLVSLNVEKHNDTHYAIVAGEANGSLVKKILKKLDKCHYVWTNGEMNNVSEGAGLLTASLPILAVTTVGSAINNAVFKPLARAVGFKGLRCKKRKHESEDEDDECEDEHESEDEDHECEDEDDECEDEHESEDEDHEDEDEDHESEDEDMDSEDEDMDSEDEDMDSEDEDMDSEDEDMDSEDEDECEDEDEDMESEDEDECEDDEEDMDSDDDEDHGCKKNDCKKKKNWLSQMWDKMYKKNDKNGGCRKLNVKSKSVKPKSVKPKNVKKHKK